MQLKYANETEQKTNSDDQTTPFILKQRTPTTTLWTAAGLEYCLLQFIQKISAKDEKNIVLKNKRKQSETKYYVGMF